MGKKAVRSGDFLNHNARVEEVSSLRHVIRSVDDRNDFSLGVILVENDFVCSIIGQHVAGLVIDRGAVGELGIWQIDLVPCDRLKFLMTSASARSLL